MNISGSCKFCGGKFEFQRCDEQRIYIRCSFCHRRRTYTFPDKEAAHLFAESENRIILNRLRVGLMEWETTHWDELHHDIVEFINTHAYAENDMRFQMAIIACITKGFQIMDAEIYQRCTRHFKIAEDIYKGLMETQENAAKNAYMSRDMEVYEQLRSNYNRLKSAYIAVQSTKKAACVILKQMLKPLLPF